MLQLSHTSTLALSYLHHQDPLQDRAGKAVGVDHTMPEDFLFRRLTLRIPNIKHIILAKLMLTINLRLYQYPLLLLASIKCLQHIYHMEIHLDQE